MKRLNKIYEILLDSKAKDIKIYDYENKSPFFDYVIIATANSRQSNAISSYLKKTTIIDSNNRIEGKNTSWTLVDLGDIIVHLFDEHDRKYYNFDDRLLGIKQINL